MAEQSIGGTIIGFEIRGALRDCIVRLDGNESGYRKVTTRNEDKADAMIVGDLIYWREDIAHCTWTSQTLSSQRLEKIGESVEHTPSF